MKKLSLALALVGAAGLVTACGGDAGDESGSAPENKSGESALTDAIDKAEGVAADVEKQAEAMSEERTVTLQINGMS